MKINIPITTRATKSNIAPEGTHHATVQKLEVVNNADGSGPKTVKLEFKLKDLTATVKRPYVPSFGGRNPFRADCIKMLGRPLTQAEEKGEFETDVLIGCNCRVSVQHKKDGFGNPKAIVKSVLAADEPAVSTQ